jgi:hypothetical protein
MDSAVTILIEGHGKEDLNTKFNNDGTLELLSFVGLPGEYGIMKICKYVNKPVDIIILNHMHRKYFYDKAISAEDQKKIFYSMGNEIKDIYKNCEINFKNGFTYTWPRLEREFIFEPGEHENCRICNDPEEEHIKFLNNKCVSGRCLPERNKNKICCPEYGLTIVSSSFPEDQDFTLAGYGNRIKSNINIDLNARDHWKNRTSEYKYLIDQIFNEKYIHLTDLNLLFKSMGFKNVYIYDPSCRDCEIDPQLANEYANLERKPPSPSINVITEQPGDYIPNPQNSRINSGNSMINDCVNGICKIFQKSKVDGGTRKRKHLKTKARKSKRYIKKSKRKYFKKSKRYLKKK